MATARRPRVSAQQRREEILAAALHEFSHKGLHGGSTMTIAQAADLSHPNLFRLFSTKKELFMEVLRRAFDTVSREMVQRGEEAVTDPVRVMAQAWNQLMNQREFMLMLLQGYAASDDPDIRDLMHDWTQDVFQRVEAIRGVGTDAAHRFVAEGMLYMVATAMNLPSMANVDAFAKRFLNSG
ncbi:helix-turn-helix domain containing protein [Spongiactinospora sp. TRM90649]|uniref:TetR/AcrR family transcriptional regulator n=1 Tax=Spongiactinospora sp. TRM90649 TaxID=3031114 RepID=UPI0023F7A7C7|nr:helix-turn-helix domain containing protein [Spongiactinospora sp. TRM90649]MDF5751558.1 helix-turn-helix domain containing protein [Spongiactinospora sp. TRM90649]